MSPSDRRSDIALLVGIVLIATGLSFLAETFNLIPPVVQVVLDQVRRASWPLLLVLIGVLVILVSVRGGSKLLRPSATGKLFRSRSDRMIAGVCGGLASYLGIDAMIVRVVFVLAAWTIGVWQGLIAYIVLAMIIPSEPSGNLA
jgi:phage shock protein C